MKKIIVLVTLSMIALTSCSKKDCDRATIRVNDSLYGLTEANNNFAMEPTQSNANKVTLAKNQYKQAKMQQDRVCK